MITSVPKVRCVTMTYIRQNSEQLVLGPWSEKSYFSFHTSRDHCFLKKDLEFTFSFCNLHSKDGDVVEESVRTLCTCLPLCVLVSVYKFDEWSVTKLAFAYNLI